MTSFVASSDVPKWMAEEVARVAHRRGCGAFDGGNNRLMPSPRFEGRHRDADVVWASIHVADLCNALDIHPDQIAALKKEPTS